jgi:2'-5' RNA ligase
VSESAVRLFSALVPPAPAARHLAQHLDRTADLRWEPDQNWHVTLGFYGAGDDPEHRSAWLRAHLRGQRAFRLRLAGADSFPGVLWIAVSGDEAALHDLAEAAGSGLDDREYRPHLTLARFRHGQQRLAKGLIQDLSTYQGPEWTAGEVVLFASSPQPGESARHTVLDRIPLT